MADEIPSFDDLPAFDDMQSEHEDAAPTQQASGGTPAFDDIPAFDDMEHEDPGQQAAPVTAAVKPEGPVKTFARRAANDAPATVGGLAMMGPGAAVGAEIGAVAGPIGALAGGVIGAGIGAFTGGKVADTAKNVVMDSLGAPQEDQLAANAAENPNADFAGGLADQVATLNPLAKGVSALERAGGAAVQAGMSAAQGGSLKDVAVSGAMGAVSPRMNKYAERIGGQVPGRPNKEPNPDAAPVQDEAATSQQATVSGDNSLQQPPPSNDGATIGNPASASTRSDRQYGKDKSTTQPGEPGDMVTTGDYDPGVAAALGATKTQQLQDSLNQNAAKSNPAPTPIPDAQDRAAVNGVRPDMTYVGEQLPIKTGMEGMSARDNPAAGQGDVKSPEAVQSPPANPEPAANPAQPGPVLGQEAAPTRTAPEGPEAPVAPAPAERANASKPKLGLKKNPAGPALETRPQSDVSKEPSRDAQRPADAPRSSTEGAPAEPVPSFDQIPDHPATDAHVSAPDADHDPSPAQKEADNHKVGRSKMFGHDISWENAHGSTRTAKDGSWKVDNLPYDYGRVLKTIGADGEHVDIANVGTGDKHFIIDQRNAETGKFDEHKLFANVKDEADARRAYSGGFSDGKGPERLGAITEVSPDEAHEWLADEAPKEAAVSPAFEDRKAPEAGRTPKAVTAAVKKLSESGLEPADKQKAIAELQSMPKNEQLKAAAKINNGNPDNEYARPDRVRGAAPKVEGMEVTARSKADAERKAGAVKAWNDLFEKHAPVGDPKTEPRDVALQRIQAAADEGTAALARYRPNEKPASYQFLRAAKAFAKGSMSQRELDKFKANEALLRSGDVDAVKDVGQTNRIEADIARNKRQAPEAAPKDINARGTEDALNDAIDAKRAAERKPFDSDETEQPVEASKTKVEQVEDLKKFETKQKTLDLSKPKDQAAFETDAKKVAANLVKMADRKAPEKTEGAASAVRKIDVKSGIVDHAAIIAAMDKAQKKNYDPAAVKAEELGKQLEERPKGKTLQDLWGSESGSLNYNKIKADWAAKSGPAARQLAKLMNKFMGFRANHRSFMIDNLLKREVGRDELKSAQFQEQLKGHHEFWDTLTDEQQRKYQVTAETSLRDKPNTPALRQQFIHDLQQGADGLSKDQAIHAEQQQAAYDGMYKTIWGDDDAHGIKENYVDNYAPHIFEEKKVNGQTAAQWINAFNQSRGPTWYTKNRVFDTILEAEKAGFKLKFNNPLDMLNARADASRRGHTLINSAESLTDRGYAVNSEDASDWQKRNFTFTRRLPNGETYLFHPDTENLWKNAIDDPGLQGNQGIPGSLYRGWMKYKRTAVPIQLSMSLFHEAHIGSIAFFNNMSRAFDNAVKGDGVVASYKQALADTKQDLLAFPGLGKWFDAAKADVHSGKRGLEMYGKDDASTTAGDKMWNQMYAEAGWSPRQAKEDIIGAKRDFQLALRNYKMDPSMGSKAGMILPAARRGIELSQEWMFKHQIPTLKVSAFQRAAIDAFKHNPDMATNPDMRSAVLQDVAKAVDDRFGEKFYRGWFINKGLKDSMLASFVSTGWQAGQVRQIADGGRQIFNAAQRKVTGVDTRGSIQKARDEANNAVSFVAHYVGGTMLAAGGLSYALSGVIPTGMDYIFPRSGSQNDDGTPNRLSTPFNTREGVQLKAHIDEKNSVLGGLGTYIWNKTIFQPLVEAAQNRNFFGQKLWDPDAGPFHKMLQAGDSSIARVFNPISAASAGRAYQQNGAKGAALAVAGFGPAPQYANEDAVSRRLGGLYESDALASAKPYEYGPKTGLGNGAIASTIRTVAGDKTAGEARGEGTRAIRHGRSEGDQATIDNGVKEAMGEGHMSKETVKAIIKGGTGDQYKFSKLPAADQIRFAQTLDAEHYAKYVTNNTDKGITRYARKTMEEQFRQRNLNQ